MMKLIKEEISNQFNSTRNRNHSYPGKIVRTVLAFVSFVRLSVDRLSNTPDSIARLGYLPVALTKPKIVVGRRK